jgi:membrane-bound lytic murein transglycosylase D
MPYRNVLSFARRIAAIVLGSATIALTAPAVADESTETSSFFSLSPALRLTPEMATPSADDTLTVHEIRGAPQLPNTIDLTVQSTNLWERIRNGFAMADLNDSLVLHYQQWYQNRPDALRRMVERSRPYLHHIVEELEARGMPTELALLPMVESSFNPNAYSPAHAAGLWQFIPATGKRFNLEQNWWRDERRDVVASTGAALDYLQTIYDMHGDWHLALASYNWGEGAVKRAINKNEARGLPTDYPNLTMPNETRHYVPKLQALKNIFGNPALIARLDLPFIPNEPYFATLETSHPIDVKTAARLANMSLEEFQRLNPSHNRPIIKPDTAVVIPADKLDTFRDNLQNSQTPLTQWQAYTVTSAERLDRIAARFDTTAAELARVNGLSGNVRLGAGSTLLVPGNGLGLRNLLSAAAPQHIIEPERSARGCGKAGKRAAKPCAAAKAGDNIASGAGKTGKGSGKIAAGAPVKAKAASAKPAKAAAGKPAKGPVKATKPGPGKRG